MPRHEGECDRDDPGAPNVRPDGSVVSNEARGDLAGENRQQDVLCDLPAQPGPGIRLLAAPVGLDPKRSNIEAHAEPENRGEKEDAPAEGKEGAGELKSQLGELEGDRHIALEVTFRLGTQPRGSRGGRRQRLPRLTDRPARWPG